MIRKHYPSDTYVGLQPLVDNVIGQGPNIVAINNDGEIIPNQFWMKVGMKWLLKDGDNSTIIQK